MDALTRTDTERTKVAVCATFALSAMRLKSHHRVELSNRWWTAKSAVKTVRRDNGRTFLVLVNGTEVPISRGYASELREAGWLTEPA